MTPASANEQRSAGLERLSPAEIARFEKANDAYRAHFGFPFVICVREHSKETILEALDARLAHDRHGEMREALQEIAKIARLRLQDTVTDR